MTNPSFRIFGIGTDLVDIRRIEKSMKRFPEKFLERISSPQESLINHTAVLGAKRFAAKEACSKALGVGIGQYLSFKDITLRQGLKKPPELQVTAHVLEKICKGTSIEKIRLDLSLSDEYPYVQAFVIISFL